MLPSLSRGLRLALVMALSVGYVAWQGHDHDAFAKKGGDSDDSGDDDGGDDGGDSGAGDAGADTGGDDDDADDKDQPAVTAGGLFTMASYPVRELSRPLTMTQGITQLRLGLGTDLSAKGAFETFGLNVEGTYGATDNFSVIGGMTDAYNFKQFGFYAGFEGSLIYDLLDIRLAANVHRNALPEYRNFCTPVATGDPVDDGSGPQGTSLADMSRCKAAGATIVNLPNGVYHAGGTQFSIDLGLPFRYAFNPQIAIVALQTLMSIDFNSVSVDHVISTPTMVTDPVTGNTVMVTQNVAAPNGAKPDLKPSIGVATNPIPLLSIVVFAQLRIPDFDTSAGAFQIPVTGRIEASPSQKLDIGLEFTLLNVKPPDGQSPIDNRFLSLFMQARY